MKNIDHMGHFSDKPLHVNKYLRAETTKEQQLVIKIFSCQSRSKIYFFYIRIFEKSLLFSSISKLYRRSVERVLNDSDSACCVLS